MAITDTITRATPYVRRVFDDEDLRDRMLRAGRAGRTALRPKPAPKPTRVKRAGAALREAGAVVGAFGEVAERERRARRRSAVLRTALLGGAVAAAGAGAVLRKRSGDGAEAAPVQTSPTTQENAVHV